MATIGSNLHTFEGDLYRENEIIRTNYDRGHQLIESVADLKSALRHGRFAWPGYPLFFITSDGAALSFKSAREEFYQICYSIRTGMNDGWRVVAVDVNYEDSDLFCDHSGEKIESAY
tara:strand:- start:2516 stop:2866 length:351 start_codon:yes stop_codon:yes gene_type:complete